MAVVKFPSHEKANKDGLLAVGGDLEYESLLLAYSQGIFPWPVDVNYPIPWFSPDPRGLIKFSDLHLSDSLKKFLKKTNFRFGINNNFERVIFECATSNNRKTGLETWIIPQMMDAYIELYKRGYAFCAETYQDEELVGGIYGVVINNYVCGESMFYLEENASKFALVNLIEYLKKQGILWLDTQMVTPVVRSLGGSEVPRKKFLEMLAQSIDQKPKPSLFSRY